MSVYAIVSLSLHVRDQFLQAADQILDMALVLPVPIKTSGKKDMKTAVQRSNKKPKKEESQETGVLICLVCQSIFMEHFGLIRHMANCHPDQVGVKDFVEDVDLNIAIQTRTNDFKAKEGFFQCTF